MTCIIDASDTLLASSQTQDIFTVRNLTAAGIQPGSTCIVEGCYEYTYESEGSYVAVAILTPKDVCTIQG